MHLRSAQPRMLVYSRVEAPQPLHILVSLNVATPLQDSDISRLRVAQFGLIWPRPFKI
jgi:hypothetical protein